MTKVLAYFLIIDSDAIIGIRWCPPETEITTENTKFLKKKKKKKDKNKTIT